MTAPLLLTIPEAARLVGVGKRAICDLIAEGTLTTVTIPGQRHRRVTRASIDTWLGTGAHPAPERHIAPLPNLNVTPFGGSRAA